MKGRLFHHPEDISGKEWLFSGPGLRRRWREDGDALNADAVLQFFTHIENDPHTVPAEKQVPQWGNMVPE
jgi:hypothetical protein